MKNIKFYLGICAAVVLFILIVLLSTAFIVTETQQAIVTKFGRPIRVIAGESNLIDKEMIKERVEEYNEDNDNVVELSYGAGLYFKMPFIHDVEYFDDRVLEYDAEAASITTGDKKRIIVDNFARWKIIDPLQFRIRLQNEKLAQSQLDDIIYSVLRGQLGEYDFIEIIRSTNNILQDTESEIPEQKLISIDVGRTKIMEDVTELVRESALEYGIFIIDVRIKRADLPEGNLQAVYENMNAERERIAEKYREEGKRNADIIRSKTDREVKTMLAEAERKAQVIKGEAEAEAARIYASGFIKQVTGGDDIQIYGFETDPDFFQFRRSLEALEYSMDSNTQFILDTNNELLKQINQKSVKKE